jgi:glucose/arabinose dehydrogenase
MIARVLTGLVLALAVAAPAASAAPRLTPVGSFDTPVHVAAPPGDGSRLFVVEREGAVRLIVDGGAPRTFLDLTGQVDLEGEEGLLSIAFAPDYATSRRFYVFVAVPEPAMEPGSRLEVLEFMRSASDPNVADPATRRTVIAIPHPQFPNHNGGQLQFGPDGLLYVSVGDGGSANDPNNNAQSTRSLLGKLLRIDPRPGPGGSPAYTVPADNPFASGLAGAPEVFSYGLRNPWRFSFDRETGDLTLGDVGQGAREEIDFVPRAAGGGNGANFGWRCYEGRISTPNVADCEPPGHVLPVHDYDSNNGFCGVTGGYVVRDPALPTLRGRYLYADLCSGNLRSIALAVPNATSATERQSSSSAFASVAAVARSMISAEVGPPSSIVAAWITQRAGIAPAVVSAAPPSPIGARSRDSRSSSGPAARAIAAATPPPWRSSVLAALATASTSSVVTSAWMTSSRGT